MIMQMANLEAVLISAITSAKDRLGFVFQYFNIVDIAEFFLNIHVLMY